MIAYCYGCESRHETPVAAERMSAFDYRPRCPNPTADKFCACGHPIKDCAPERCSHGCSHEYARDAMWGNT